MDDWDDKELFQRTSSRQKFMRRNIVENVDSYLHTADSIDGALLKIITERDRATFPQQKINAFVSELLIRGAHIDVRDENGNTPLHLAALMGLPDLTKELLEWGADVKTVNSKGELPMELALKTGLENDDRISEYSKVAKIVIKEMEPARVRDIFIATLEAPRRLDFQEILFREGMQKARKAILGTLIEPLTKTKKTFLVNYSLLETNRKGEVCPLPAPGQVSTFEAIVRGKHKDILVHPIVRLFIESGWQKYAKNFLIASFFYWFALMGFLTTALVLAVLEKDPRRYKYSPFDIVRGICEGMSLLLITLSLAIKVHEVYIWRAMYFKEKSVFFFSYVPILTALFLYILVPLRAVGSKIQWIFASLAYFSYSLIAFRFLLNIRKIGKYVLILWSILIHDLVPFLVVFLLTLFSFTGGLYLLLREEESKRDSTTSNVTTYYHKEQAGSYPMIFFTGIRMMIEGNKIIDYYHSFGWLGKIAHLLFLFSVVVVLRSLLIAQMNHTYSTIQDEANTLLILVRARSVLVIQKAIAGFPKIPVRKWFATEEIWRDPQKTLRRTAVTRNIYQSKAFARLERMLVTQRELVNELRDHMFFEHRKLEEKLLLQPRVST